MKDLIFILLFLMVSCAQQKVVLQDVNLIPFEDFSKVTTLDQATLPVKLFELIDQREKMGVGEARTGAQFKETPVEFRYGFSEYFKDYIKNSLKRRNVLMVMSDEKALMSITVKEFWTKELLERFQPERATCKISIDVKVQKNGDEYNGSFWTEVKSPGDMGDATEKLAPTIASCMNIIVEKIVNDQKLLKFIESKPLI
tara:strand:- start:100 stop:696 length:597 start_codon:yes stop_codon:yes gene_type:complete